MVKAVSKSPLLAGFFLPICGDERREPPPSMMDCIVLKCHLQRSKTSLLMDLLGLRTFGAQISSFTIDRDRLSCLG
jgi:hypothetical protein